MISFRLIGSWAWVVPCRVQDAHLYLTMPELLVIPACLLARHLLLPFISVLFSSFFFPSLRLSVRCLADAVLFLLFQTDLNVRHHHDAFGGDFWLKQRLAPILCLVSWCHRCFLLLDTLIAVRGPF